METVLSSVFFFSQSKQIQNGKVWSDCHMINYLLWEPFLVREKNLFSKYWIYIEQNLSLYIADKFISTVQV